MKLYTLSHLLLLLLLSLITLSLSSPSEGGERRNPFDSSHPSYPGYAAFTGLRFEVNTPVVEVEGEWYELVSIDGFTAKKILDWSRDKLGDKALERFEEDLPVVLELMGRKPSPQAELTLRKRGGGEIRKKIVMTEENRSLLRRKGRHQSHGDNGDGEIDTEEVCEAFEEVLEDRFAYLGLGDVQWKAALKKLKRKQLNRDQFAQELGRVMAMFADGHASVSDSTDLAGRAGGFLPFLIEPVGEGFVAFDEGRQVFLEDGFPWIESIDGRAIGDWLDATAEDVAKGSSQYQKRHGLRALRNLDHYREKLGLPKGRNVVVKLSDGNGKTTEKELAPASRRPSYGIWPRPTGQPGRIIEGNIGYLRLESMDEDAERSIAEMMPKLRDTHGLIVDVRDNGGGSRKALLDLASWLMAPGDEPRVANVAAYRKWDGFDEDHLAARFMARAEDASWTADERKAISAFAQTFKPEWLPPRKDFSEWHFLLLSPPKEPRPFVYTKPIIVLQNAKCFSATDIFLAALKGWRDNITLLGTASGGGSARSVRHRLPGRMSVRCASMASFQPDGKLYDGNGVEPDLVVHPVPEFFLDGGQDVQLEAARQHLLKR